MAEGRLPRRARDGHGAEVPSRLLASWQRSEDYGVSLETVEPVFAGTGVEESLFVQCGNEVLTGLHATLMDEPVSLMLTDSDGLVLSRLSGDTSLLTALDAVHLAPGFAFSERDAGTNGLGLALADRTASVVRADEHYSASLCTYTCAAVPVFDPVSGRLEGAVNLTTWSRSSDRLLLALAQSAAGNTAALMLARSRGRSARPASRGEVFRVRSAHLEPGAGALRDLSPAWADALAQAERAMSAGRVVAAVGEPGSGRATLLALAHRRVHPRDRILSATCPAPQDVEAWLSLWGPELGKPDTGVVVRDVDHLPAWAAGRLGDLVRTQHLGAVPLALSLTAEELLALPGPLAPLVDTVVQVPPLRERPDDVPLLAEHLARRARGRDVPITPAAARALRGYSWPGNADQLARVVREAVSRGDTIDVRQLPAEILSGSRHRLGPVEAFEREMLVRALTRPGATAKDAAAELGISRATVYRKIAQYDVRIPGR
ncbi:hypothetical protein KRR39_03025 [Nocardioides panacis]|uniref:Sigma-54 factor interaction domain-containing protein n=1 Tax=Nocardioides panacis TaxID=2849501 RepID=A0A975Y0U6_9ACTN|nr:helix-turn-helix domain-containing protein [Nocardioides panacis]QWZ08841.1 hypothetical protein KRR39_03025 [Nocardioides panacis]